MISCKKEGGGRVKIIFSNSKKRMTTFKKGGGQEFMSSFLSEFSVFSQIQMHTLDTSVEEKISWF